MTLKSRHILAAIALCIAAVLPADARVTKWHHGVCTVTGYVWTGNRTSVGRWPQVHRTVAVDPSVIPYGSQIHIAGLPWSYVAEDSGGMVHGWHLDVFVASVAEAYAVTSVRTCAWR